MHRRVALTLLAAVLPVLAACTAAADGHPIAGSNSSPASVKLFDPCTAIPDEVLHAVSVDPATKESGIAGVHQSGWEVCNWNGKDYFITILSTGQSIPEVEKRRIYTDFRDVTIAGRGGKQFRVDDGVTDLACDIAFSVPSGVVMVDLRNRVLRENPTDPCMLVRRVSEFIVPVLPK
ncbi:DUF3558 domain-containing protein [Nocardia panacis]|uniref:DUF3558 domain-containing protein n=1 Tax=Nocardia panacis TaxID=2340916 RepID=UPI001EF14360|nr:DUF3558 domain-containing protein [Nocardia panacis]